MIKFKKRLVSVWVLTFGDYLNCMAWGVRGVNMLSRTVSNQLSMGSNSALPGPGTYSTRPGRTRTGKRLGGSGKLARPGRGEE